MLARWKEWLLLSMALGASLNLALGQAGVALGMLGLLLLAVRRQHEVRAAVHQLGNTWWAPLSFFLACGVSVVTTAAPWADWDSVTRFKPFLVLPVAALLFQMTEPRVPLWAARLFAVGCALHAAVGLAQVAWGVTPGAELLHIPLDRRHMAAPGNESAWSAVGLFYNRVRLSHVLAAGAAVACGLAVTDPMPRRWVWFPCALVTFAGLLATYGRGALLGLLLTLGVAVLALLWRNAAFHARLHWVLGPAAIAVLMALAFEPVRTRLASGMDLSQNADRLFLWGRGVEMALDYFPFGAGMGGYSVVRDSYYNRVNELTQSRAMSHNQWLSLLAETGVAGLMAWMTMWWALFARVLQRPSPAALAGALGALTFLAATFAHDPLYQSECALAWGFCAALMTAREGTGPA